MGENPGALRLEVEECGRNGGRTHCVLACGCHATPVTEETEVH